MTYVFKDAEIVRKQIEALKALYPEIEEDAQLLADTVEGETDFDRVITKVLDFVREAECMAAAVKARKDEIAERQQRYERQSESGRKVIQQLMYAANQTKVTLPEATISITTARKKAEIVNADELPQGFFRNERKPLGKEILAALNAGEKVPGAVLSLGQPGLMVRTK